MSSTEPSGAQFKVVIADPSWLVRDGIAHLLRELAPRSMVHTAIEGSDLHRVLRSAPDLNLVLIGKELVGDEEEALFRHVRKLAPGAAIGVLGDSFGHEAVRKAIYFGAMAVIATGGKRDDVMVALGKVLAQEVVFPQEHEAASRRSSSDISKRQDVLTPRETDVFALLGEGLSVPLIAGALRLSPHTVRVHIARIMKKFDLHDRSALMHRAVSTAGTGGPGSS